MNALDKVIAILEAFLVEGRELRLSELCEITGLNKSTAHVVAQSLVDRGYLTQHGKRGTYFLGVRFIEYANVVQRNLHVGEVALPYLTEFCEQVNETAELAVRDGHHAAVLETVRSKQLLSVSGTGRWAAKISLHNTACGKVLLAHVDAGEWKKLRRSLDLTGDTPNTITHLAALEKHLAEVRQRGYAIDDEETEIGIRSIAAPVWNFSGEVVAALYVIGPKSRMTNAVMKEHTRLVKECASRVSRAMGFVAPDGRTDELHRAHGRSRPRGLVAAS